MANFVETTGIPATTFVEANSRYRDATVLRVTEKKLLTFNIYKRVNIRPSRDDQFTVITSKYEYRPDLLSSDVYGTVDFWWQILQANNIFDIFDFKIGLNIRLPEILF